MISSFNQICSQRGQTSMMMVLAAAGLVTVAALSVAKWSQDTLQLQKVGDPAKAAQLLRENILNSLGASGVWEQSLLHNPALSSCMAAKSCAFSANYYVDFDIYSNADAIILQSSVPSQGFDLKGVMCNAFDPVNGSDACPLRFVTQVRADCSSMIAGKCDVQIKGSLYYSPLSSGSSLTRSLSTDKYAFNFHLGAIDGTMQAACVALGGSFNKPTLACDVTGVNLTSTKTGISLAQLTQLCPSAQQIVTDAISAGTISEVVLSQCQLGANLAKNCASGSTLAGSNVDGSNDCRQIPTGNYCLVGSSVIPSGGSATFYQTSSVPFGSSCVSESRYCLNGDISGSFTSTSCTVAPALDCNLDGTTIVNGASVTAYKVGNPSQDVTEASYYASQGTCTTEVKTCSNGVLSGSSDYTLKSCLPTNGQSCVFNGQKISSGRTVTAYQSSTVGFGQTCSGGSVSCLNGVLTGAESFPFSKCEVNKGQACTTGSGVAVNGGGSADFYRNPKAESGNTCAQLKVQKVCRDGVLVGDVRASYEHCSEEHGTCKLGEKEYESGKTVMAFSIQQGSASNTCGANSKLLLCSHGSWVDAAQAGSSVSSYVYRSCSNPTEDCRITTKDSSQLIVRDGRDLSLYSVPRSTNCSSGKVLISCNKGVTNISAASYYGECEYSSN